MLSFFKTRRRFVVSLFAASATATLGWWVTKFFKRTAERTAEMIKDSFPLDLHYPTPEPFLFCAHHDDAFPTGTAEFGVDPARLAGRRLGMDFEARDGFRMYHGESVPGFPVHPHRGFETITIVRRGFVDHSDSLGAAGRYGAGDVQWLTAGRGIQHCEMMPLLHATQANPTELFQIWLNLPRQSKQAAPHYTMFWAEDIPRVAADEGRVTVTVIAGQYGAARPLAPPPESWANDPANQVTVLLIKIAAGGTFDLPPSAAELNRSVYVFAGRDYAVGDRTFAEPRGFAVDAGRAFSVRAAAGEVEVLVLQGRPIGEPVVQQGPFVMNSRAEIFETINEYQRTHFGGWPWPREDMVHGGAIERFAKYPDGRVERRAVRSV